MPRRLHRQYGAGHLHFITTSCYQRRPWLDSDRHRDMFVDVLERVRRRYHFVVVGYVVMPEHVHLLLSEPDRGTPSTVMQALKQGFARRLLRHLREKQDSEQHTLRECEEGHIWQKRFYDFVVFTADKRGEKLHYMHQNPVRRGLVAEPEQWGWSSFGYYRYGKTGTVLINERQTAEMKVRNIA